MLLKKNSGIYLRQECRILLWSIIDSLRSMMNFKEICFVLLLAYISLLFILALWSFFSEYLLQENKERMQHLRETHNQVRCIFWMKDLVAFRKPKKVIRHSWNSAVAAPILLPFHWSAVTVVTSALLVFPPQAGTVRRGHHLLTLYRLVLQ